VVLFERFEGVSSNHDYADRTRKKDASTNSTMNFNRMNRNSITSNH
jgi:hypothetical protein